jgi:polysaccharide export outer membrane protein
VKLTELTIDFSSIAYLRRIGWIAFCLPLFVCSVSYSADVSPQTGSKTDRQTQDQPVSPGSSQVLAIGDELKISELNVDEFNDRMFQVASDGTMGLPLVGRVEVAGETISEFEHSLDEKLKRYIKNPRATVTSVKYHGRSVSLVGEVNSPGAYQITEPKTLLEMLSLAGGLKPDAGSWLLLTRKDESGKLPEEPNVTFSAGVSEARIPIGALLAGRDPQLNLTVVPNDVIMISKAEMVYAVGEVRKQGGFVLGDHEQLSLIKLLSMAEGLQTTAAGAQSRIIHESGETRTETPVDVQKVLQGKANDIMLKPDDVLFVPSNTPKKLAIRAIEAIIATGTGIAIYRR